MLEDRDYMRSPADGRPPLGLVMPLTVMLMIVLVVAFALQQIDIVYFHFSINEYLALSTEGLRNGYVWQLLTFQFLHGGLLHLGFNLIALWCFGRYVEVRLGKPHFLMLYFLSGIAGGLLQALLGWVFPYHFGGPTVGASAGICGLLAAFSMLEPEGIILVSFLLPMRAKYLLYISLGIAGFFTIVPSDPLVAHAAHLGGMLFGMAYVRWMIKSNWQHSNWRPFQSRRRKLELVKAASLKPGKLRRSQPNPEEQPELPSEEFIATQVDPILDKISAHGIQSLTERERQILQAARNKMTKR